jgi:hypothetical protein
VSSGVWGTISYADAAPVIIAALEPLRGLRLSGVTRAGDMISLSFGELRMTDGRERAAYALRVQAPWRLDHLVTGTITGRADVWDSIEEEAPAGWRWDKGPNLRDHLLNGLFGKRKQPHEYHGEDFRVEEIEATAGGDVRIRFAGPYELRILPEFTRDEAWRIFRPARPGTHFVFTDGLAGYHGSCRPQS